MKKLLLLLPLLIWGSVAKAQAPPVCTFAQVAFNAVNDSFVYHCPNTNNWYPAMIVAAGGGGTGGGLLDPGANGIVLRTAVDVTTIASSADIISLFGGCTGTSFLRGDGTCQSITAFTYPSSGVAVSSGPSGPWSTSLQVGTAPNNLVQLNSLGQLPGVSAALLTNFPILNQNTTGNAATATAFGATPVICANGQAPRGIVTNGNATGCQVIGVNATTFLKPDPSTALIYTAKTCTGGIACADTNDGLSWGTAKATLYGAACSLPGGNCATQTSGSGTIMVGTGSTSNPIAGDGFWLMGVSDPNFAAPPLGWLKCGSSCTVYLLGVPNTVDLPNGHASTALVFGGSQTDRNSPALWESGVFGIRVDNIAFVTAAVGNARPIVIGECSNHTRANCGVNGMELYNDTAYTTQGGVFGPGIDISSNSYWLHMDHIGVTGNSGGTNGFSANNAAAILIDGTGNNGSGLTYIDHCNFDDGGLLFIPGSSGGGFSIKNCTEESSGVNLPPVARMTAFPTGTYAYAESLTLADNPNTITTFENDDTTGGSRGFPVVVNTNNVKGPAVGTGFVSSVSPNVSPLVSQKFVPAAPTTPQRANPIVPQHFSNLAYSNPANWTQSGGSVTITTGILDPFEGHGAATLSSVAGGTVNLSPVATISSGATGSYIYWGAWLQGGGWSQNSSGFLLQGCPSNGGFLASSSFNNGESWPDDGEWHWIWFLIKSSSDSGNECTSIQVNGGISGNVYGPVYHYIPAGTKTDNDMLDLAWIMSSSDSACPVGSNCNVSGHPLNVDVINQRDPVSLGTLETHATAACETSYGTTTAHNGTTTITTGANCLPANAVIEAVLYRITTTLSGNAISSFTVGDGTIAGRFCGTQSTLTAGTTGICYAQTDQTGTSGPIQTSAAKVVVTEDQIATAGAIRLLVYYHTWTPPTN